MNTDKIQHLSRRLTFEAGTYIFAKGQERDCAYIVINGEIEIITNHGENDGVVSAILGPGKIFGEMALLEDGPRTAAAKASQDTEVFAISREVMRERMAGLDPIVGMLLSLLIDRYRKTRMFLPESIDVPDADEMIARLKTMAFIDRTKDHLKDQEIPNMLKDLHIKQQVAFEELDMEQKLREGIENDEFTPRFQPIVDLKDGTVTGFETLIRWEPEDGKVIAPGNFIPVAERVNMVQYLDFAMLRKACESLKELHDAGADKIHNFYLSVNLSGLHFDGNVLIDTVRGILKATGARPEQIKLEITESALIDDPRNAQTMLEKLKETGVKIALDDFGTGYSSLGYLHKFPIDSIKIDRSFVSQIQTENRSVDIINAIIGLAQAFKMDVIAEGIEEVHDWNVLNNIGCGYGQGYYFGRPLSLEDAKAFVASRHTGQQKY